MIADLAEAARALQISRLPLRAFRSRGNRTEALCRGGRYGLERHGIGAFYDDDVHRYLGFLEEGETCVGASLHAEGETALVMLGSPSRHAAAQDRDRRETAPVISESGEEHCSHLLDAVRPEQEPAPRRDPRTLPQQVIYHFAVGRAIPDPQIGAPSASQGEKRRQIHR